MRSTPALTALLLSAATVLAFVPVSSGAAGEKQLRRVQGNVGYQTSATAPFTAVFGRFDLPDDAVAVTQTKSTAELIMPDSSIIGLGENTRVQVGAFDNAAAGPGSTVIVNGGALRFDVRRPAGGRANYRFVTATSQIAVRGTIGLLSFIGGNTTVVCVACAADSVSVTVGGQTFALATGQVLTVGITGAVTTGAATAGSLQTFTSSGLNVGANGAAIPGAAAGAGASGAGSTGLAIGAGIAAVAGGIAISQSNHTPAPSALVPGVPNPTPSPSPTPTVTPSPHPSPVPTASPVPTPSPTPTIPGTVTVTGKTRAAGTAPVPTAPHLVPPAPAAAAPQPLPPPGLLPRVSPRMR